MKDDEKDRKDPAELNNEEEETKNGVSFLLSEEEEEAQEGNADPEVNEEDKSSSDSTEEEKRTARKKFYWSTWKKVLVEAIIILLSVGVGVYIAGGFSESPEPEAEIETETEVLDEMIDIIETELAQPETVIEYVEVEAETENWKDTIFGTSSASMVQNISVTGMTSVQKDRSGFREADFLAALSDFLDENHISGITSVNFEEEITCSADGAYAFRATLGDRTDKVLNVIVYPDYPGEYILTLQDAQEVSVEVQTQNETAAGTSAGEYYYPQSSTQSGQTNESSGSEARTYDASTLSVNNIPTTLANYISNQYELQYTLYDFLYRNGYDVSAVSVTDYEINADTRQATINFILSDGSTLTGIYAKDSNTYSYR